MSTSLFTSTSTQLLASLLDGANQSAWRTFDARIRPVLIGTATRLGMKPDEAEDVAQQTLLRAYEALRLGQFNGGKGKLRAWIVTIAHNAACDVLRRRRLGPQAGSADSALPDEARVSIVLSQEWNRSLLHRTMELIRTSSQFDARTIRAFELVVLHCVPVREAAAQCEMTEPQVYVARSRVRARFMQLFRELGAEAGAGE